MKIKVSLSFPNYENISLESLSKIPIRRLGFVYSPHIIDDEDGRYIQYYPKQTTLFYRNSFIPIITVKKDAGPSWVVLNISGKMTEIGRIGTLFFYVIIGLLQCFFLMMRFDGYLFGHFEVKYLPALFFVFLFVISNGILSIDTLLFANKFRRIVEELNSTK